MNGEILNGKREVIDDETITDAILDNVVHSWYRVELKCESLRKIINK